MNYYIKGDAAKADKIKAAFEKLGYNTGNLGFTSSQLYFTIEGKVELICTKALQNLIKTHPDYKELELPVEPKFKVGDWLVYKNGNCFAGGLTEAQVVKVKDGVYSFASGTIGSFKFIDECCRLWTIQDAKDGDVLALNGNPFIYSSHKYGKNYCYIDEWGQLRVNFSLVFEGNYVCPATKQERDLLFSKMREVGYEWDADKKELHKIKPHYDIANFKPFDKVLVRDRDESKWGNTYFGFYDEEQKVFVCDCYEWEQCIPFEGNEHLLGTTDPCDEQYINW